MLNDKCIEVSKFESLAAAVEAASNRDIVEIRGDGPFVTPPIKVGNRALTLRAAAGLCPIIRLNEEATSAGAPVLETNASLILEGLEFGLMLEVESKGFASRIAANGPSLSATNCRFHWPRGNVQTATRTCRFRNCQFATTGSAILWFRLGDGDLAIDNSVQAAGGLIGMSFWPGQKAAPNVRIARSTIRAETVFTLFTVPEKVPVQAESGALIDLALSASVIDVDHALRVQSKFEERAQLGRFVESIDSLLQRVLKWRDRQNVYADGLDGFLALNASGNIRPPFFGTVADWEKASGQSKTESSIGRVVYMNADPLAGFALEAFRLRADSAGYRAGKDGKDLGADIDLVGPGPAYERWKKTREYQEWLKETGQKGAPAMAEAVAAKKELAKWQGEWENADHGRLVIQGERWSSHPKNGFEVVSTIKIIEVTDQMTHILLLNKAIDGKVRTIQTILRVDGDTLHNCGTIGFVRPAEFANKPGSIYTQWKRVSK